jgi:hypothetical protein
MRVRVTGSAVALCGFVQGLTYVNDGNIEILEADYEQGVVLLDDEDAQSAELVIVDCVCVYGGDR